MSPFSIADQRIDDDELDFVVLAIGEDRLQGPHGDRHAFGEERDAIAAGCAIKLVDQGRFHELPAQGMLARPVADHQNSHVSGTLWFGLGLIGARTDSVRTKQDRLEINSWSVSGKVGNFLGT